MAPRRDVESLGSWRERAGDAANMDTTRAVGGELCAGGLDKVEERSETVEQDRSEEVDRPVGAVIYDDFEISVGGTEPCWIK